MERRTSVSLHSLGVRVARAGAGRQVEQLARPHDDDVVRRQGVRGRAEVDALRLALRQRLAARGLRRIVFDRLSKLISN